VDGRDKPGHDGERSRAQRNAVQQPTLPTESFAEVGRI
jgi:hypothetical protein